MTELKDTDKRNVWQGNPLLELCGIQVPIIQAPMAEVSTPRLVAAVSNAGGLGSLGAAYLPASVLQERIREIRTLTTAPFAVNLFIGQYPPSKKKDIQMAQNALIPYRHAVGLNDFPADVAAFPEFKDQIKVILEEKVPIFSFAFGIPPLTVLQQLKREKIITIGTATTVEEARLLETSGVDAIIAQGLEAGGHRATFQNPDEDLLLSTASLLMQLHPIIRVPLIAAGGIMNGESIAAALILGAHAVQMGTAFIGCPESGATRTYKKAILNAKGAKTVLTNAFSGKSARVISNRFVKEMQNEPIAPFPYQHFLTKEMRSTAAKEERADLIALYAGQNYAFATDLPAGKLISILEEQTIEALEKGGD